MTESDRIAAAPITWGVCEVPDYGYQLAADRVLAEISELGLAATEAGPEGYLGTDSQTAAALLRARDMHLVGGFVPAALHQPHGLETVERNARLLAAAGADVMVLAVSAADSGYDASPELSADEWRVLLEALDRARVLCHDLGLDCSLHPHVGTVIERRSEIDRVLQGSTVQFCIDTGHLLIGGTDPVALVSEIAGRVNHVHLKDVDAKMAERVHSGELAYIDAVRAGLYQPLGAGSIDIASVVDLLEDAGYEGWYVLEQDLVLDAEPPPGAGPIEDAGTSVAFLRSLLAERRAGSN